MIDLCGQSKHQSLLYFSLLLSIRFYVLVLSQVIINKTLVSKIRKEKILKIVQSVRSNAALLTQYQCDVLPFLLRRLGSVDAWWRKKCVWEQNGSKKKRNPYLALSVDKHHSFRMNKHYYYQYWFLILTETRRMLFFIFHQCFWRFCVLLPSNCRCSFWSLFSPNNTAYTCVDNMRYSPVLFSCFALSTEKLPCLENERVSRAF